MAQNVFTGRAVEVEMFKDWDNAAKYAAERKAKYPDQIRYIWTGKAREGGFDYSGNFGVVSYPSSLVVRDGARIVNAQDLALAAAAECRAQLNPQGQGTGRGKKERIS